MKTLNTEARHQLYDAIKSAYRSSMALEQMLKFELDVNLTDIVGLSNGMSAIVFRLIEWAEERGRIEELVGAAYRDNPHNAMLREFVEVVWPHYATRGTHLPRDTDAACGIAPRWSVLEDVHKAFGQPDDANHNSTTKINAVYAAQGVDVTLLRSPDRRWIVDLIRLRAPFAQKLSLSGLYIAMPLHDLKQACAGKYYFDANSAKRSNLVLEPMHTDNCRLTVVLESDKVIGILMQRKS